MPSIARRVLRAAGLVAVWCLWAALLLLLSLGALKEDATCGGLHLVWAAAGLLPLVIGLGVTFAARGRFEIVPVAFAVATAVGAAAAVTLTLAPDAWPVVVARFLRLCE